MDQIINIDINKLHPHPDNPRRSVEDVTELADSIRHSGVMQNLTVVPHEGDYRVIIGHRRLAAAKEAGLTELPCRVVEMDQVEQIHTMMSENMQRKDLTPPEEAFGVQMLLDLGESDKDIQQKTGMSRTTFYHRKAMAQLPADELQKSYERGGTLADYVALEQIKDLQVRTNLLKEIGTKNFEYKLSQAKSRQELNETVKDVLLLLEPVAKKLKDSPKGCSYWKYIYIQKSAINEVKKTVAEIEADSAADYSFVLNTNNYGSGWLYIYRDGPQEEPVRAKTEEEIERERKNRERKERIDALNQLHADFKALRAAFIASFRETDADLKKAMTVCLQNGGCYVQKKKTMRDVFGGSGTDDALEEAFDALSKATPGAVLLAAMEEDVEDCFDWNGGYVDPFEDDRTEAYLKLLESLGYSMSDAEKAYWNGTHELFSKEDEA
ncbi:MAG: ParB/RepB/Spo0J family partition protein [Clostridia bacterium]|nr:ParB/RepB/Spo0J family partition protein [Clostridia bacterium]